MEREQLPLRVLHCHLEGKKVRVDNQKHGCHASKKTLHSTMKAYSKQLNLQQTKLCGVDSCWHHHQRKIMDDKKRRRRFLLYSLSSFVSLAFSVRYVWCQTNSIKVIKDEMYFDSTLTGTIIFMQAFSIRQQKLLCRLDSQMLRAVTILGHLYFSNNT